MQLGQICVAGGFGMLGGILIVGTADLAPVAHIAYGPSFFPTIVGTILIVLAGIASLDAMRAPGRGDGSGGEARKPLDLHRIALFAAFATAPLLYVVLAPRLGFLLTMPLLVAGLSLLASGRPLRAVLLGVMLTLALHVVFSEMLRVTLPWGILTDYAGTLTWR